jgi:hypothetical protein
MAEAAAAAEVAAEEAAAGSEEAVGTTTTDCPAATARERAPQSSETALCDPASEAAASASLVETLGIVDGPLAMSLDCGKGAARDPGSPPAVSFSTLV